MRRVVLIPILHNAADLGSLAATVRAQYEQRFGPAGWHERQQAVEQRWSAIARAIDALGLDFRHVRLYQDGLPVCGKEGMIVQELAAAGSTNHQLLLKLIARGAKLMGSEDPQLLIREYQLQRGRAKSPPAAAASADEAAAILAARDAFLAGQIAGTLAEGETALVFLGAAHRLVLPTAADLSVETLRISDVA